MQQLILLASGVGVGFVGTLLGLGGGFILVPVLIYAFHEDRQIAVGTSHVVICLNAFSGAIAYDRQRKIDYRVALWIALAAVPSSFLAAWFLVKRADSPWFLIAFAAMLILGAVYISMKGRLAAHEEAEEPTPGRFRLAMLIAVFSGFIAATLGIGGGVFYVPMLALLLGRPFHRATATSQFILLCTSLVAAAVLIWRRQCDPVFAIWLGIGVLLGAQLGAAAAKKLEAPVLKKVFAVVVSVVAAKLAWDGIAQLAGR